LTGPYCLIFHADFSANRLKWLVLRPDDFLQLRQMQLQGRLFVAFTQALLNIVQESGNLFDFGLVYDFWHVIGP